MSVRTSVHFIFLFVLFVLSSRGFSDGKTLEYLGWISDKYPARLVLTAQTDDSSPEIRFPICWGEFRRLVEVDGTRFYEIAAAWCAPNKNGYCPGSKECLEDENPIILSRFKRKDIKPSDEAKPKSCWGGWIKENKMPRYASINVKGNETDTTSVPVKFALGEAVCEFENEEPAQRQHAVACMTATEVTAEQCRKKNLTVFNLKRLKDAYSSVGDARRRDGVTSQHRGRSLNSEEEAGSTAIGN
ncbi:MAG: hypothetical protein HY537_06525 [Deltaproteobacteria bacterium]|nr:hypothetical protein [Deltaproteobacteria bacterium]